MESIAIGGDNFNNVYNSTTHRQSKAAINWLKFLLSKSNLHKIKHSGS